MHQLLGLEELAARRELLGHRHHVAERHRASWCRTCRPRGPEERFQVAAGHQPRADHHRRRVGDDTDQLQDPAVTECREQPGLDQQCLVGLVLVSGGIGISALRRHGAVEPCRVVPAGIQKSRSHNDT